MQVKAGYYVNYVINLKSIRKRSRVKHLHVPGDPPPPQRRFEHFTTYRGSRTQLKINFQNAQKLRQNSE